MTLLNNFLRMVKKINKKEFIIFALLSFVFLFIRIYRLDADLPPFRLTGYQPIDEFYYSITAFNLYHYGEFAHKVLAYIPSDGSPINLIGNLITYLSLSIFGNNYYGLRMGTVFASYGIFILLLMVTNKKIEISVINKNIFLVLVASIIIFNFPFIIASRVNEPTIFRMLGMVTLIYMCSLDYFNSKSISPINSFILGFSASALCFFIYPTNFFLIAALGATVYVWGLKNNTVKKTIKLCFFYIAGVVTAALIYWIYQKLLFADSYQMELINNYSPRIHSTAAAWNLFNFFRTNIFRLNEGFLFLFLISLPFYIYNVLKSKNDFDLLILNLFIFLLLQTFFINDYYYRKLVLFFPIVLIIVIRSLSYFKINNLVSRLYFCVYLIMMALLSHSICASNLPPDYPTPMLTKLHWLIPVTIVFGIFLYSLGSRYKTSLLILLVSVIVVSDFYFIRKELYLNSKFQYRNSMMEIGKHINNKIVAGGWAFSMRLYNTSKPVLSFYQYYGAKKTYSKYLTEMFLKQDVTLTLGYSFDSANLASFGLKRIVTYDINSSVFNEQGSNKTMSLYGPIN